MPQLDFRQAFASLDQDPGIVILPQELSRNNFAEGPAKITSGRFETGLGWSGWTNISFVALATLGGFACAFYFFNGADVLRAAAAWPREFLYPRPVTSVVKAEPRPQQSASDLAATQSDREKSARKTSSGPFGRDYLGDSFSAPSVPAGVGSNSNAGTGFSPAVGSALSQLSSLPRGADALFQSLYHTVTASSQVKSIASTSRRAVASAHKKIAAAKQTVGAQTSSIAKSVSSSTSQASQQAANSTRSPVGPGLSVPGLGGSGGSSGLGGVGGLGGIGGGGVSLGGGHGGGH